MRKSCFAWWASVGLWRPPFALMTSSTPAVIYIGKSLSTFLEARGEDPHMSYPFRRSVQRVFNACEISRGDNTYLRSQRLSVGNRLFEPRGSDFHRFRWRFLAFYGSQSLAVSLAVGVALTDFCSDRSLFNQSDERRSLDYPKSPPVSGFFSVSGFCWRGAWTLEISIIFTHPFGGNGGYSSIHPALAIVQQMRSVRKNFLFIRF